MSNDERSGGKRDGRIALRSESHTRKSLAVILAGLAFAVAVSRETGVEAGSYADHLMAMSPAAGAGFSAWFRL